MNRDALVQLSYTHPILFYDGVCCFCNRSVQFLMRRDKQRQFRYAPLQSTAGKEISDSLGYGTQIETVIALYQGEVYTFSDVTFLILRRLGGIWNMLLIFRLVPKTIRDKIYRWFANHRYGWFGKEDRCVLPDPQFRDLFLDFPGEAHTSPNQ